MGSIYVLTLLVIIGLILILITLPCRRWSAVNSFNSWLYNKLAWNFVIRLIFEESLETSFSVILMFKYGGFHREAFGSSIDYVLSMVYAASILSIPFWMVWFYIKWFAEWQDEEFDERYGSALDGLKKGSKISLFYPVFFVIRRVSFAFIMTFMHKYQIF